MRWLLSSSVLFSATAAAQTVASQPPDPATDVIVEPAPVAQPPEVTAPDGAARNYERAPEGESIRGGSIVRGLGTGVGYVFRGIFAPFRGVMYLEARWGVLTDIRKVFMNDAETLGLYPTVSYSTGYGLTFGARAFLDNFFGVNEDVSFSAKTGGVVTQQYQGKLGFSKIGGSPLFVRTRVRYEENPNLLFAGIGGEMATRTRYSQERFLTVLAAGIELGNDTRVRFGGMAIYNDRKFGAGDDTGGDPSIETVYDTAMLRGFDDGVKNLELTADFAIDTRDVLGPTHDGAVLRAFAGGGSLVEHVEYAHYGAEAAYYISPFWPGRVFVGRVALEGIRDRDNDVPFTELPRLGGAGLLRGYSTDQFRDKLATTATLEYHYPIHANISGDLFVEAGKVGPTYDALYGDGLRENWHVGYGGGLIIHSKTRARARIDVAYGDGFNVYFSTDVLDAFRRRETEL